MVADSSHCPVSALILLNGPLFYDGSPTRQREIKRYQQKQETKTQDFDAMNKTSLLMLIVGTILGIVIGYVTFSTKPAAPENIIQAEGFRNIELNGKKVDIEITKRIDADNLEIIKNIQMPIEGFAKGYSAMEQLVNRLVEDGVLGRSPAADSPQE